ncbi:hypothetical protein SAMN05421869_10151 [Nonomuraea jiangxiensis]|uniref:Uncharacterized protein n=1 Tax=Nonomuraea jiangxiensis TaxID=633440 RepID=A0A1G7Y9R4_9ACTN|nr:hypothetical protein SAMN05421869_10151 [Nonomuraea jiangxiensis]
MRAAPATPTTLTVPTTLAVPCALTVPRVRNVRTVLVDLAALTTLSLLAVPAGTTAQPGQAAPSAVTSQIVRTVSIAPTVCRIGQICAFSPIVSWVRPLPLPLRTNCCRPTPRNATPRPRSRRLVGLLGFRGWLRACRQLRTALRPGARRQAWSAVLQRALDRLVECRRHGGGCVVHAIRRPTASFPQPNEPGRAPGTKRRHASWATWRRDLLGRRCRGTQAKAHRVSVTERRHRLGWRFDLVVRSWAGWIHRRPVKCATRWYHRRPMRQQAGVVPSPTDEAGIGTVSPPAGEVGGGVVSRSPGGVGSAGQAPRGWGACGRSASVMERPIRRHPASGRTSSRGRKGLRPEPAPAPEGLRRGRRGAGPRRACP